MTCFRLSCYKPLFAFITVHSDGMVHGCLSHNTFTVTFFVITGQSKTIRCPWLAQDPLMTSSALRGAVKSRAIRASWLLVITDTWNARQFYVFVLFTRAVSVWSSAPHLYDRLTDYFVLSTCSSWSRSPASFWAHVKYTFYCCYLRLSLFTFDARFKNVSSFFLTVGMCECHGIFLINRYKHSP